MTTAADLINRAMLSIGVLGEAETASAAASNIGLDALNELLGAWSNEGLMIYETVTESFPFVPSKFSYTIGLGGDFNTTRPMSFEKAYARLSGIDYEVKIVTLGQYQEINNKASESNLPLVMALDAGFPLTTLLFWYVPNTATTSIYIDSKKPLSQFALTTVLNLPPGYERALRLNLAVEIMPSYGRNDPLLINQATTAKSAIKRSNYVPIILDLPHGIPTGQIYQDWRY